MAEEQINSFINESEHIIEIEIDRLRDFQNHPFKVQDDDQMELLRRSIEKYGILTPLIVRPKLEGYYEIISGHRRRFAAKKLGYDFNYEYVDTYPMSQRVLPELKKNKLNNLADYFGITFRHHRALSDAFATAEVFIEMSKLEMKRKNK
ncbi:MAG: ParB N-terminal domain-containing protein [Clostridia bacterium]|nr:ParB N-terminal domain-containing protein [Clostridia bacterium]